MINMNTRVRYKFKSLSNSLLVSTKTFTSNVGSLEVIIDLNTLSFDVISTTSVVASGRALNASLLKKAAKAALVSLGVTFNTEVRTAANTVATSTTATANALS